MSYILDALRRADAERDSGRVPGIHSQPFLSRTSNKNAARKASRRALWVWGGTALVLLGAIGWWASGNRPGEEQTSNMAPPASALSTASGVSEPPPAPPPSAAVTLPPALGTTAPAEPILAPPRPQPAPAATASPATAAKPQTPKPIESDAATTAVPPDLAIPRLDDLPAALRAQWPPLLVSGSTYSGNVALRMLIVNGKVVQEGQDISPGLRLETIAPRHAIVSYQGQRARIAH